MKNFYKLNFGHKFLNDNATFKTFDAPNDWQTFPLNPKNYINHEVYKQLLSIKVFPNYALLFKGKPGKATQIHIDGDDSISSIWAINISWGSDNSSMVWYKINQQSNNLNFTSANNPFVEFRPEDVEEIERTGNIFTPTLVRIDIPHCAENLDNSNFRYCFSVRGVSNHQTWDQLVDAFSKFIED